MRSQCLRTISAQLLLGFAFRLPVHKMCVRDSHCAVEHPLLIADPFQTVQAVITDNAWGKLTENQQAAIMLSLIHISWKH